MILENEFQRFFFTNPSYIFLAANSGVFIMGIGKSFLSVIGVLIKPGLTTETLTLISF